MDSKKKLFLFVSAIMVFALVYFTVDMMSRTTPPWQRKLLAGQDSARRDSLATDDLLVLDFADTVTFTYKVRKNEVLGSIAEKFHFGIDSIKIINGLTTDNIREGQRLKVPVRAMHQVQNGEALERIARKYSVSAKAIMEVNGISSPSKLRAGATIAIPRPQ